MLRRSSTTPLILSSPPSALISFSRPSFRPEKVWSLKVVSRTTTVLPTTRLRAATSLIVSRTIETSKGSGVPSRTTVMRISEPTGPRIMSTA